MSLLYKSWEDCTETVDFCSTSITALLLKAYITEARRMREGNVDVHADFIAFMGVRGNVGVLLDLDLEEVIQLVAEQNQYYL